MNTVSRTINSTWPKDNLLAQTPIPRNDANHLICFLACAFEPKDKADDLWEFIQNLCNEIGSQVGANIECVRADKISTPGIIHRDIWNYIAQADVLIFDVTSSNGNVLIELGVASAIRSPDNIIVMREKEDTSKFLFDISSTRHLIYSRTLIKDREKIISGLFQALMFALAPAPFKSKDSKALLTTFKFDSEAGYIPVDLLSPLECHRALLPDGLEFGSYFNFRSSWITIGEYDYRDVQVKATLRISSIAPGINPSDCWVGIALRSLHIFVDYGYLVYVKGDGEIYYLCLENEKNKNDIKIGVIQNFSIKNDFF